MARRVDFLEKFTAVNSDVLSGSALDPMPGSGFVRVYAAEIVHTGTIEISPANHPNPTGNSAQHIIETGGGNAGAPNHPAVYAYDPHWETEVVKGEKLTIRLAGTISECLVWVQFIGV